MEQNISLYDYVMAHLDARSVPQRQAALESGVPFSTLTKIAQRQIRDPSVHTIQRLADYFTKVDAGEFAATCQCGRACPTEERKAA